MLEIINKIRDFFYDGPVKDVPKNHKHCPPCGGTGDDDPFMDCLYCEGRGYVSYRDYVKIKRELGEW